MNKFNILDIVCLKGLDDEYKVMEIEYTHYHNIIWYTLWRLSDGYKCKVKENGIEKSEI